MGSDAAGGNICPQVGVLLAAPWENSPRRLEKILTHWGIAGSTLVGFTGTNVALVGHIMVDPIFQSDNYVLARKLLDAAVVRQEAIAANIANAETPGYRRVDLSPDFNEQLKAHLAAGDLSTRTGDIKPSVVDDPSARSLRPDGNSVEIEHELLAMNRNAVEHEYLSEIVSQNIKQLRMAITGRTS